MIIYPPHDWLYYLQSAAIALGAFACLWGFTEFWHCLYEVLIGKHNQPTTSPCPMHASIAVCCLCGLAFAAARANAIGLIPAGGRTFTSFAFAGGMIGFAILVGFAVWAKDRAHWGRVYGDANAKLPKLSYVFSMVLIIILAFLSLGLLRMDG